MNNINHVIDRLFIGDHKAASTLNILTDHNISHIVNATQEVPNYFKSKFHYINLGLKDKWEDEDILGVLEPSYRYIDNVLKVDNSRVLVHCHAGISRSASIVIYYLMKKYELSFEKALNFLKNKRMIVSPNPWYTYQLKNL